MGGFCKARFTHQRLDTSKVDERVADLAVFELQVERLETLLGCLAVFGLLNGPAQSDVGSLFLLEGLTLAAV